VAQQYDKMQIIVQYWFVGRQSWLYLFCGIFMKLELHVSRKNGVRHFERSESLIFAIIDLDRSRSYPENFVCVLPHLHPTGKSTSAFYRLFGDQNLPLAKKLLTRALKTEDNFEVKTELQRRIDTLNPKPAPPIPCRICGNNFIPKKTKNKKYQQRICQTCKTKITPLPS